MDKMDRRQKAQMKVAKAQAQAAKAQAKVDRLQKKNSKANTFENAMVIMAMFGIVALAVAATIIGLTGETENE